MLVKAILKKPELGTDNMKVEHLKNTVHLQQAGRNSGLVPNSASGKIAFDDVLKGKISKVSHLVKFSAHAVERLASRNIILTEQDISRINDAVNKMAAKGGKDSLLVMGELAFVVSVENKTIITAMGKHTGGSDQMFTNIDSALII